MFRLRRCSRSSPASRPARRIGGAVLAACVLAVGGASSGADADARGAMAQPREWRVAPAAGEVRAGRVTVVQDQTQSIEGVATSTRATLTYELRHETLEPGEDGVARLRTTLTRVRAEIVSGSFPAVVVDSAEPETLASPAASRMRTLLDAVGTGFEHGVTGDGRIVASEAMKKVSLSDAPAETATANLHGLVAELPMRAPAAAVAVGDSWDWTQSTDESGWPEAVAFRSTLRSAEGLVEIDESARIPAIERSIELAPGTPASLRLAGTATGRVAYDPATGWIIRGERIRTLEGGLAVDRAAGDVEIGLRFVVTTRYEPLPTAG